MSCHYLSESVNISYGQWFESLPDKIFLVEKVICEKRFIDLKGGGFALLLISYFQHFVRHSFTCRTLYANSHFLKPKNNWRTSTAKLAVVLLPRSQSVLSINQARLFRIVFRGLSSCKQKIDTKRIDLHALKFLENNDRLRSV